MSKANEWAKQLGCRPTLLIDARVHAQVTDDGDLSIIDWSAGGRVFFTKDQVPQLLKWLKETFE